MEELPDNVGPETRVQLTQFLAYVRSFWLGRIGPDRFCVYNDANRTNNLLEAQHRLFNAIVGLAHPAPWLFLGKQISIRK
jgi:hypothetical protein